MGQGIGVRIGGGVIAGKERAGETAVNAGHHGMNVTAPAAENGSLFRQLIRKQIPCTVVGILDQDILTPGTERALTGGTDLPGHLLTERI